MYSRSYRVVAPQVRFKTQIQTTMQSKTDRKLRSSRLFALLTNILVLLEQDDWHRDMCFLLQNLCEEFEFEIAQFFRLKTKRL